MLQFLYEQLTSANTARTQSFFVSLGMIDQVVAPDDVDGLTRLVLVNAVYFKGLWKSRFRPENTKKRPFYGADGKTYQVPMLSQLSIFRCGKLSNPHYH